MSILFFFFFFFECVLRERRVKQEEEEEKNSTQLCLFFRVVLLTFETQRIAKIIRKCSYYCRKTKNEAERKKQKIPEITVNLGKSNQSSFGAKTI